MNSTGIFVRLQVEGFHCWPGAPPHRAYLAQRHRHQFHVEVRMPVGHADREVELHDLIDQTRTLFPGGELGGQSCEIMASTLADALCNHYQRTVSVTVEDGEAGANVVARTKKSPTG